jgi:hypothetical protein
VVGPDRLLDSKTQEKYYTKIVERYMSFCTDAGKRDELLRRFTAHELSSRARPGGSGDDSSSAPTAEALQSPEKKSDLSHILMALRKLREGIVAAKRCDEFAIQAYIFCIRLSVLVKQPESYHPALLYLLRHLHPQKPLSSVELQEVVGYLVLDAACRRRELAEAYSVRQQYKLKDAKVNHALHALAHDNYILFRRVKDAVDGHRARLMEFAEADMRMQTLKAFGRAYLGVDLAFLETVTGRKWEALRKEDGVGWELDDGRVTIRRIKR